MNYRHSYHAGNFADVLKHAVLVLVIEYMKRKEAPFRVIDTHAGTGHYALTSPEATKTGEWQDGIGRLIGPDTEPLSPQAAQRLQPYLDVVRRENADRTLAAYPGSPVIALALMRPQDRLIANELHPEDRPLLKAAIGNDHRAKVMDLDAWLALKSLLPPRERRGVVLIDPPFEERDEFDRLAGGLAHAVKRFATGTYIAWYPIKDPKTVARFHAALAARAIPKILRIELMLPRAAEVERLNGCGLVVVNPPYTLEGDLSTLLPELSRRLSGSGGGRYRLDWIDSADNGSDTGAPASKRRMRTTP